MTALDKCLTSAVVWNVAADQMTEVMEAVEDSVLNLHQLEQEGRVTDLAKVVAVGDLLEARRRSQRLQVALDELIDRIVNEFHLQVEGKGNG